MLTSDAKRSSAFWAVQEMPCQALRVKSASITNPQS
jgi:hypothetical protein